MNKLDEIDLRLLRLLQKDASLTHKQLAANLGLTTTPIFERVKRLEREGIIESYVAIINAEKLQKGLLAICEISLNQHSKKFLEEFEKSISPFEEVVGLFHMSGGFDYLLQIRVKDMNEYMEFTYDKLAKLENIGKVQSSFVLRNIKNTTQIPIPRHVPKA